MLVGPRDTHTHCASSGSASRPLRHGDRYDLVTMFVPHAAQIVSLRPRTKAAMCRSFASRKSGSTVVCSPRGSVERCGYTLSMTKLSWPWSDATLATVRSVGSRAFGAAVLGLMPTHTNGLLPWVPSTKRAVLSSFRS